MGRGRRSWTAAVLAAVLGCCLLLAGCSLGSSAGTGGGQVTITYAMWQTNLTDYMKERIASFEAANPNIHVELKTYADYQNAPGQYWQDMNAASREDLPDVFQMNALHVQEYQRAGKLLELDNLISGEKGISVDHFPDSLTRIYEVDGRQYGIPIDYDTIGLWYNKDLFDKAGVAYPTRSWTWEDFTGAARKINALGGGVHGFIAGNQDQLGYYNTVAACGGTIVQDDRFGFDDEKTQAGIQYWVDLTKVSPTLEEIDASGGPHMLFMQGKAGMVFGGDWEAADFTGSDSTVASVINVTEMPTMPNGKKGTVIHGKANVISAGTKHAEEAKKFLTFLSAPESYEKLGATGKCIPAYADYADTFFGLYPQYDMGIFAREAVEYGAPFPSSSLTGWSEVVVEKMTPILKGTVSVRDGCAQIMDALNAKAKGK